MAIGLAVPLRPQASPIPSLTMVTSAAQQKAAEEEAKKKAAEEAARSPTRTRSRTRSPPVIDDRFELSKAAKRQIRKAQQRDPDEGDEGDETQRNAAKRQIRKAMKAMKVMKGRKPQQKQKKKPSSPKQKKPSSPQQKKPSASPTLCPTPHYAYTSADFLLDMPLKDVLELGFHGRINPISNQPTHACKPDYRHMTLEDFLRHVYDMVQEGALTIADPEGKDLD